jgi:8-oxo-dGTP pyrophosphatase MutT (NUDIX family)
MKTQVVQKAIILDEKGQMLMLRRGKTDERRPLQWDLPGGLHEENEELMESVRREITEETGLQVTGLEPIYSKTEVRTWKNHGKEYTQNAVFIFYKARAASTDVKISYEHDKFQWKPVVQALEEYEYKLHGELIKYALDNDLL